MDAESPMSVILDTENLMGDVRDALLDRIKTIPHSWKIMKQEEQADMIDGCERIARNLVTEAVRMIAANGRTVIPALLEQCTIKDGVKAVLTMSQHDPHRHELTDAVGKPVLVVVADASQYMGGGDQPKPEPDQSDILDTRKTA